MYKILVPVDGSEPAERALDEAIDLAEGKGPDTLVTLLYVSPSPIYFPYYSMVGPSLDADVKEVEEKQGNELLNSLVKKIEGKTKAKLETKHLYGIAAQEIVNYADDTKVNMIVMGNRGMGAFGKVILGSVSSKVLHLAECPVVIVIVK
ncbi:universal stress protein [Terrilactibacillus sp. S3-3]|nr:universal stress protein [Terrilactibacillus sp. S3-3]